MLNPKCINAECEKVDSSMGSDRLDVGLLLVLRRASNVVKGNRGSARRRPAGGGHERRRHVVERRRRGRRALTGFASTAFARKINTSTPLNSRVVASM